jgi:3-phosphoglycerate kinase
MEQEIRYLSNLDLKTNNKMVLLLGGAKISSKLTVIEYFLNKSNYILIGGAMSFTFLKALGYNVGHSLVEDGMIDIAKSILSKSSTSKAKIILPIDFMCSNKNDGSCIFRNLDNIQNNDIGFDIGKGTIKLFKDIVSKANLILWNGPLGLFEKKKYSLGTTALAKFISSLTFEKSIKSIVGGGDTANAIISLHMENNFTHISTGGGASLELLSGKKLQILESWESYE